MISAEESKKRRLSEKFGVCKNCGANFEKYRPNNKYCSYECLKEDYKHARPYIPRETTLKSCRHCEKQFLSNDSKRFYCCDECYEAHKETYYTRVDDKSVVCAVCKKKFVTKHGTKKYCSKHCYLSAHTKRMEHRRAELERLNKKR